jgi:Dyp-type peroxidase family
MTVQGNVLRAYGVRFPCTAYVLLRIAPGREAEARALLDRRRDRVSFDREPRALPGRAHLNLAFTFQGLQALGAPVEQLPDDFEQGAARRAPEIGDRVDSAPDRWEFGNPPAHVLAVVHAVDEAARAECLRELDLAGGPLEVVHEQHAGLLHRGEAAVGESSETCSAVFNREHFGFADGCSQPAVEDVDDDPDGDGVHQTELPKGPLRRILETVGFRDPKRKWRGVALGEFVLGYENEDWDEPEGSSSPIGRDGTFMVYRKLYQDVQGFDDHTARCAEELGLQPDEVRARIVGRWQDGTPLAVSPDNPDPEIARDRARANHFGYLDDPAGEKCPIGAHIRRTNPRDGLPAGGEATMRHRMIRRGMPYTGPGDDDRGLLFVCFGASIERGFETVQRQWCTTGFALGLDQPDYLLQQRPRPGQAPTGTLQIRSKQVLRPPPRPFVTVRGTEYLLLPGREALARITRGPEATP